jgi:hypothetical protein
MIINNYTRILKTDANVLNCCSDMDEILQNRLEWKSNQNIMKIGCK